MPKIGFWRGKSTQSSNIKYYNECLFYHQNLKSLLNCDKLKKKLEILEEYKKSLIYEYETGKKKVKQCVYLVKRKKIYHFD